MHELSRQQEIRWIAVLFAFAAILLSVGMKRSGYEGTDERRYAQVSREITGGEGLFVMHHRGKEYPDKPPLFFWLQALSFKAFGGVSPFAARVPLWTLAMLALAFTYLCVRQVSGAKTALIATASLLLMYRFFWCSRWARLDGPMSAFVFGSFWASSRILFPHPDQKLSSWRWAMLAWAFAGLAVLTKGTGAIAWLGGVLTYCIVKRDWGGIRNHHPLAGLALLLAIVGAWLIPAMIMGGPDYYGEMLGTHVKERLLGSVAHSKVYYYYLSKVVPESLPPGVLLPIALWYAWRNRKSVAIGSASVFYLCWFLFSLVFFSLPEGKRGQYILPLYPALAALIGQFVVAALDDERLRQVLRRHLWAMLAMAVVLTLGLVFFRGKMSDYEIAAPLGWRIALVPPMAILCGLAVRFLRQHRELSSLAMLFACIGVVYAFVFGIMSPLTYNDTPAKTIAKYVEANFPDVKKIGIMGLDDQLTMYRSGGLYFPKTLTSSKANVRFMQDSANQWLIGPKEDYEEAIEESGETDWRIVKEWNYPAERDVVVLLQRQSGPTSEPVIVTADGRR